MKTKYTKKQISEAIAYWTKQLKKMNESQAKLFKCQYFDPSSEIQHLLADDHRAFTKPIDEKFDLITIADILQGYQYGFLYYADVAHGPDDQDHMTGFVSDDIEDINKLVMAFSSECSKKVDFKNKYGSDFIQTVLNLLRNRRQSSILRPFTKQEISDFKILRSHTIENISPDMTILDALRIFNAEYAFGGTDSLCILDGGRKMCIIDSTNPYVETAMLKAAGIE